MKKRCIGEESLIDYMEGRLSDKVRLEIEAHLSRCDMCLGEAVICNKMISGSSPLILDLAELDPAPERVTLKAVESVKRFSDTSYPEKIVSYVSDLISKGSDELRRLFPFGTGSLSPVRGSREVLSDDLILLRKSFTGLEIEIKVEKTNPGLASIRVSVIESDQPSDPVRATLFRNSREISSYLINGSAPVFENIPFGRYLLRLTRNGEKAGEYSFNIKESGDGKK